MATAAPLLFGHLLKSGDLFFLTSYNGLESIDLSDLSSPRRVGHFYLGWDFWEAGDIELTGNRAYLDTGGYGLQLFDV